MEKHKKKTGTIKIKERKHKYEIPLSLKTWEEKVAFLHQIHQEINEKGNKDLIYSEPAKE